jgi:dehydrogenase/reductase SDR family protein 12
VPETTETTTLPRPADEVFRYLADFGNLAEWDPMFDRSERLDEGPLGVGSRFHVVGSAAGSDVELTLEIVEYDEPRRVVLSGTGDGLRTREDLQVRPADEGCEVTYTSSFETDKPDLVDAATAPAFWLVGKRAIRGLEDRLGDA